jgi:hypothetical protein
MLQLLEVSASGPKYLPANALGSNAVAKYQFLVRTSTRAPKAKPMLSSPLYFLQNISPTYLAADDHLLAGKSELNKSVLTALFTLPTAASARPFAAGSSDTVVVL